MPVKILLFLLSTLSSIPGLSESLPSIPDTIFISEYLICGPFSVGAREGITEAIEDPTALKPVAGDSLNSGLVQGGFARWRPVQTDSAHWLSTNYPDVRWDTIQDYYGISGLATLGYAYAELYLPHRSRALAIATRIGSFTINDRTYLGDIYGNNWFQTPVILDSGLNRLILRLSGYGDQRVRFLLIPAKTPLITVTPDITAPDLIADTETRTYLGIPLLNTTTDVLNDVKVLVKINSSTVADTVINNIPALGVKKPALSVQLPALPYDTAGYQLIITVRTKNFENSDTIKLRSRQLSQPHKCTFLSTIDSSCQYYAILYPRDYQPSQTYGLILSLHGAGVEASSLVESFQPKDWAFIVCPTNRRPYGFDWQDWGRLDALEVLNAVCNSLPIDQNRIYLTGHSMGGHGTWYIGLTTPDRFAAIAPAAGWPSFPLYVPNFLQRSIIFSEPSKLAVREMALRTDNTPALVENALNLPVFILHGADDDNVPPIHGRTFALWLQTLGYEYRYKEVPGVKHWWTYPDCTACVDDPDLMSFLQKRQLRFPTHIRFRTADLGQSNRSYWLTIDRVKTVGRDATVEALATDTIIDITTSNIVQLTLNLDRCHFTKRQIALKIDGRILKGKFPDVITVHQNANGWHFGPVRSSAQLIKTQKVYGPAKQVMFSPFAIVYGTRDQSLAPFLYHSAVQECLRWWLIGNGTTEIYPDTGNFPLNRNLVLLGNAVQNALTGLISNRLPIQVKQGQVVINNLKLGDSLAAIVTYPNPLNPERLVLCRFGTDRLTTRLALFWGIIGSGTAIPDFVIFDRWVRKFGWHGVRAAGFFSPEWRFDPASSFIQK